jgi:hypothetical protein
MALNVNLNAKQPDFNELPIEKCTGTHDCAHQSQKNGRIGVNHKFLMKSEKEIL